MFDGHITPLKLYSKKFGRTKWKYKKLNPIISDYEKSKKDSKSCNDYKNSADDNFNEIYSEHDTERTTPSLEDFKNLQNCRKKMAIFRDSIGNKSDHSLKDNGKVEYIFSGNKEMYNKEYKKDKFWKKHINLQLKHKSNDLFILGILEIISKNIKNIESNIVTIEDFATVQIGIREKLNKTIKEAKLLYRASRDGDSAQFHSKCDGKKNTVTFVQAKNGRKFGGFANQAFNSNNSWISDPNCFVFSLFYNECYYYNNGNMIFGSSSYGPLWGNGNDLYLASGCLNNTSSQSNQRFTRLRKRYSDKK